MQRSQAFGVLDVYDFGVLSRVVTARPQWFLSDAACNALPWRPPVTRRILDKEGILPNHGTRTMQHSTERLLCLAMGKAAYLGQKDITSLS